MEKNNTTSFNKEILNALDNINVLDEKTNSTNSITKTNTKTIPKYKNTQFYDDFLKKKNNLPSLQSLKSNTSRIKSSRSNSIKSIRSDSPIKSNIETLKPSKPLDISFDLNENINTRFYYNTSHKKNIDNKNGIKFNNFTSKVKDNSFLSDNVEIDKDPHIDLISTDQNKKDEKTNKKVSHDLTKILENKKELDNNDTPDINLKDSQKTNKSENFKKNNNITLYELPKKKSYKPINSTKTKKDNSLKNNYENFYENSKQDKQIIGTFSSNKRKFISKDTKKNTKKDTSNKNKISTKQSRKLILPLSMGNSTTHHSSTNTNLNSDNISYFKKYQIEKNKNLESQIIKDKNSKRKIFLTILTTIIFFIVLTLSIYYLLYFFENYYNVDNDKNITYDTQLQNINSLDQKIFISKKHVINSDTNVPEIKEAFKSLNDFISEKDNSEKISYLSYQPISETTINEYFNKKDFDQSIINSAIFIDYINKPKKTFIFKVKYQNRAIPILIPIHKVDSKHLINWDFFNKYDNKTVFKFVSNPINDYISAPLMLQYSKIKSDNNFICFSALNIYDDNIKTDIFIKKSNFQNDDNFKQLEKTFGKNNIIYANLDLNWIEKSDLFDNENPKYGNNEWYLNVTKINSIGF